MKLTLIAEGSTKWQRFIRRWGVAYLLDENTLFDTFGNPGVLLNNMRKFNINAAKIKHIILSHDDWDHIAGLWYLLSNREDITVYICPGFKQEIKDRIALFGVRLVEVGKATLIKDSIYSTGELYGESDGRKIYEQSVVIKIDDGLVVICGCAHPGIVEIVQHAKVTFNSDVHFIIGGFHLKDHTAEGVRNIIVKLKELGVCRIIPFHCTGRIAQRLFTKEYGQDCIMINEGQVIEV